MKPSQIVVFYSWQSDLNKKTNHFFINSALKDALKKVGKKAKNEFELDIRLDSDTKNLPGAPEISKEILDKIEICDIFIADVSIAIPKTKSSRPSPNPNVLIELGYAICKIGWDKIILVFNDSSGEFPSDLPFDIRGHRTARYSFKGESDNKKQEIEKLSGIFVKAISTIIEKTDLISTINGRVRCNRIQRERDVKLLNRILSNIHIPTFDVFIDYAKTNFMLEKIFHFWEGFHGYWVSSDFSFYDSKLNNLFKIFHDLWQRSLGFGEHFKQVQGGFVWDITYNFSQKKLDKFHRSIFELEKAFHELIQYIKIGYIEVDLDFTSNQAREEYNQFGKDLEKSLNSSTNEKKKML